MNEANILNVRCVYLHYILATLALFYSHILQVSYTDCVHTVCLITRKKKRSASKSADGHNLFFLHTLIIIIMSCCAV